MDSIRIICPNCLHEVDAHVWTKGTCANCETSYCWKEQYDEENDIWVIYAYWNCDKFNVKSGFIAMEEISYLMNTDFD